MAQAIYDMTSDEVVLLTDIVARLNRAHQVADIRPVVFPDLMKLLRSDFLASFRWNSKIGAFEDPYILNQNAENVGRYLKNFQFRDPISLKLRALWRPAYVDEVISRRDLFHSEFFNDFLRHDGLDHGVNAFFQSGTLPLPDLRVWRCASSPEYGDRDVGLLRVLSPHLQRALSQTCHDPLDALTARERDVALLVARGCTDKDIARILDIGFATVRTYVRNCFDKLHCSNRAELAALMARTQPQ